MIEQPQNENNNQVREIQFEFEGERRLLQILVTDKSIVISVPGLNSEINLGFEDYYLRLLISLVDAFQNVVHIGENLKYKLRSHTIPTKENAYPTELSVYKLGISFIIDSESIIEGEAMICPNQSLLVFQPDSEPSFDLRHPENSDSINSIVRVIPSLIEQLIQLELDKRVRDSENLNRISIQDKWDLN